MERAIDTAPRRVKRRLELRDNTSERLDSAERPVQDAVRPLLVELAHLRRREQLPPADLLFDHARAQLTKLRTKLEALRLPTEDVQDVYYALVAFVDEAMQADQGPLKDFWQAHLLQLELFGETRAGEGFYDRLNRARNDGRSAVMRVYYTCLLFGFSGIYAGHGELERENLIEGLRSTLGISADDRSALAPCGARPDEPAADRERNRLLQWLATAAAGVSVIWYVGVAFSLDARARLLTDALTHAAEDLAAGRPFVSSAK
jgi:type IV/VI secretion system ImpK/VasF family protein